MFSLQHFSFIQDINSKTDIPEFNGYNTAKMREAGKGVQPKTKAVYLLLIDMVPPDPDTILTAMAEAQKLTTSCGQLYTVFTSDQQLYKVVVNITWVYPNRF